MYEVHSQLPTLLVHVPLQENPASAVENCQCSHLAQKYLHLWTAVKPEIPDIKNMHLWKGTANCTLHTGTSIALCIYSRKTHYSFKKCHKHFVDKTDFMALRNNIVSVPSWAKAC